MMANMRPFRDLVANQYDEENNKTHSSKEQIDVEKSVLNMYESAHMKITLNRNLPRLATNAHMDFIRDGLTQLPHSYSCLDASRTWLCYWSLHSMSLLTDISKTWPLNKEESMIVQFLSKCQHPSGGFGGGPGQYPHLATTYAAVNALCIIGTQEAYDIINRKTLKEFLYSVRAPNGAFRMHLDGEIDVRGVYCALSIATLTGIYSEKLFDGTAEWVVSCQTYEGGFSGCPGLEAHGGYTFCAIAVLTILKRPKLCDLHSLLRWLVNKQMKLEGGFQGRTNKLVDGCYSFWLACSVLLAGVALGEKKMLFNQTALQEYIMVCCQYNSGGLLDKPGKRPDLYHTCYTLSGLSLTQTNSDYIGIPFYLGFINPLYNISYEKVEIMKTYFKDTKDETL
ncbi:PREDICTED: protein farnesyltransferase subunit beta [Nicrophorus vespilloides]|uniref:Protein farnesyltransferase subunit beta n=1 Tax=Nicrophorus vespilloides TaxID=110193 RepID=A0ABM1MWE0_NICVS|nr:PREDICTED: protein farnesyltransferase subunit beta [Nicrophorus vespilloides]